MTVRRTGLTALLGCLLPLWTACPENLDNQPAYQPQEAPRLHSPAGSVPRDSRAIPPPGLPDIRRGARLFAVNCAHCHGASGHGDGPVAGYLVQLPENLRTPHVQNRTDGELYDILTNGRETMPGFDGFLSAGDRLALVAFLRTLAEPVHRPKS